MVRVLPNEASVLRERTLSLSFLSRQEQLLEDYIAGRTRVHLFSVVAKLLSGWSERLLLTQKVVYLFHSETPV